MGCPNLCGLLEAVVGGMPMSQLVLSVAGDRVVRPGCMQICDKESSSMTRNPLQELVGHGQSVWLDYLSRDLVRSGQLEEMVENDGVGGITSNPSIFHTAISGSDTYDQEIAALAASGLGDESIFEKLAVGDIQAACDILLRVYEASRGQDGFVSLEVSPHLAHDTEGTVAAAHRLASDVDRSNLLIKVPATKEGLPAIEELLTEGVNVNITLIFARSVYRAVVRAYLCALEARLARGERVDVISSVASTFVSRIDTAVDAQLVAIAEDHPQQADEARALLGKAALANSKAVYRDFEALFGSDRFQRLAMHGARCQRPLWASTSTKNPAYAETLYVDELVGSNTVNTMPESTMSAFRDQGEVQETVGADHDFWASVLERLEGLGIDLDSVMEDLEADGVGKFVDSYDALLSDLGVKAAAFRA